MKLEDEGVNNPVTRVIIKGAINLGNSSTPSTENIKLKLTLIINLVSSYMLSKYQRILLT